MVILPLAPDLFAIHKMNSKLNNNDLIGVLKAGELKCETDASQQTGWLLLLLRLYVSSYYSL